MFNPDPLRRSCEAAEENLPNDDTIQSHPGHVTSGEAGGKSENVEFARQMLRKYPEACSRATEIAQWLQKLPSVAVRCFCDACISRTLCPPPLMSPLQRLSTRCTAHIEWLVEGHSVHPGSA